MERADVQASGATTVRPCLVFNERGEEAINFYVSLLPNSKVSMIVRSDGAGRIAKGALQHAEFQLDGQEYTAFDGGPHFAFSDAFSFVVTCQTQEELDRYWATLSDGGEEVACGWLKDRFGLSWQVVPAALGEMMSDPESGNPDAMMEALLQMKKLDVEALKRAYRGG